MRPIFLFLLLPNFLAAQSDFLKNPDIVWAAEIEQDWVLDIPRLEDEQEEGITTLKLLVQGKHEQYAGPPTLARLVWFGMTSGRLPIFEDAACTIPMDRHLFLVSSDNHVYDPEASGKAFEPIFYDPELYKDIKAWRLRLVLAYHEKTANWTTRVMSIAPLVVISNEQGDSIGTRPTFWFKAFDDWQDLHSRHIVWAKSTLNKQAKTQVPIVPTKSVKINKNYLDLLPHLRNVVENRQEIPLYDARNDKLLTSEERLALIYRTDTIPYCFMDGPNGETFQVVRSDVFRPIHQIRLAQTWYWNVSSCRLSICLDAVAPIKDILNEEGERMYSRPLFYRRSKR